MAPSALLKISAFAALTALLNCGGFGNVNQGRVIRYQKEQGLVTVISDSNYRDPQHPRYDVLPPVTVRLPEDPHEMGPEPQAGMLLVRDWSNKRLLVFDAAAGVTRVIPYTLVEQFDGVSRDDPRVRGLRLPVIDRARKTVTLYGRRDRRLYTIAVADEYLNLPEDTWKPGDEVRYYYKDPARALRFMNVSKTDVNRAGE